MNSDADRSLVQAPGEAEAELAYFHSHGLVDVVVTSYNDVLLFGAHSVLRT